MDICTTRISAQHNMMRSIVRLWVGVKIYQEQCRETTGKAAKGTLKYHEFQWKLSDEDMQAAVEMEGVLHITCLVATLAQSNKRFTGAYAPLLIKESIRALHGDTISVIDLAKVTKSPLLPRKDVLIRDLCPRGLTALTRGQSETKRRYSNKDTGEVDLSDIQLIATLLDPRTLPCLHLTKEQKARAYKLLSWEYPIFGMMRYKWILAKRKAEAAQLEEARKEVAAAKASSSSQAEAGVTPTPHPADTDDALGDDDFAALTEGGAAEAWDVLEEEEELANGGGGARALTEEEELAKEETRLKAEFPVTFKAWARTVDKLDWSKYVKTTESEEPLGKRPRAIDLWDADVAAVFRDIMANKDVNVGLFPAMAASSRGQIGAPQTPNPQPSTLNPQPSTLSSKHYTLNPKP